MNIVKKFDKIVAVIGLVLVVGGFGFLLIGRFSPQQGQKTAQKTAKEVQKQETVSYKGENGKDALMLLKNHAVIEQDASGLVTSINKKKADAGKHEYWAFYVNGKQASVGPKEYVTKDADRIEWKIEKY